MTSNQINTIKTIIYLWIFTSLIFLIYVISSYKVLHMGSDKLNILLWMTQCLCSIIGIFGLILGLYIAWIIYEKQKNISHFQFVISDLQKRLDEYNKLHYFRTTPTSKDLVKRLDKAIDLYNRHIDPKY